MIHAIVTLPSITNLPRDAVVNTFNLIGSATPDMTDTMEALAAFYGANGVGPMIGGSVSRSVESSVRLYDSSDPEPRQVIASHNFGLPNPSGTTNLPLEVAICVTWRADYAAGSNPARRRGRTYVGPLRSQVVEGTSVAIPRVASSVRTLFVQAAGVLIGDLNAAGTPLGVWSRADGAIRPVIGGWVDNEFDTQRRRGTGPTDRSLI